MTHLDEAWELSMMELESAAVTPTDKPNIFHHKTFGFITLTPDQMAMADFNADQEARTGFKMATAKDIAELVIVNKMHDSYMKRFNWWSVIGWVFLIIVIASFF